MTATYSRSVAFGKVHSWSCTRCLNNRGTMIVLQLGPKLFRSDTRKPTTVAELERDGWVRLKLQRRGV